MFFGNRRTPGELIRERLPPSQGLRHCKDSDSRFLNLTHIPNSLYLNCPWCPVHWGLFNGSAIGLKVLAFPESVAHAVTDLVKEVAKALNLARF
jgi:hypothetical protein